MSDVAIHAKDLRKVYRLYTKPSYRFRDMFGILGHKAGAFTEHAALDGVSLDIARGEKVAIIGRNGAGKSTFLKLVTGVIEPTSGVLEVRARVHALLQIGTGFHPDFTGRENVYAYLAQLGITGAEADRRCAETIEFAEIEEYINQPVKTYSTGMAVRLMFSVSTAIAPDLLVLDEVLGVGDAYFSNKSYGRIRDLCDQQGTTLLLVTHDIYSAVKICGRIVWIDHGRVLMDSDGPSVVKAYEDSIRQQEESRLRARKQERLRAARALQQGSRAHVIVEIQCRDNQPAASPVYFSRIALTSHGSVVGELPLGQADADEASSHLQFEGTSWGPAATVHGRLARPLMNHGSPFHKVAGVFAVDRSALDVTMTDVGLEVDYHSDAPADLLLVAFVDGRRVNFGALPASTGGWTTHSAHPTEQDAADAPLPQVNTRGVHGTGAIVIEDVELLNAAGVPSAFVEHGRPATFVISFRIADRRLNECPQVILVVFRDGLAVARFIARDLHFDAAHAITGRVCLHVPRMMLGIGSYSIAVMIAAEGYLDREQVLFYTLNPGVYATSIHMLEFTVTGDGLAATNTLFVGDGDWAIDTGGVAG